MKDVITYAKDNIKKAQERQQIQANKKRRAVDFDVGDRVWVIKKGWRTTRLSDKLDIPLAGPWLIIEKIGHSFKL